jgi:hypothetical protein
MCITQYLKGTHLVQIEFPCKHCVNELTKFIKKSEKITDVLLILLHLYIKFQDQIHYSLAIPKKRNSDRFVRLDLSEIVFFTAFSFL